MNENARPSPSADQSPAVPSGWHERPTVYGWWWSQRNRAWEKAPNQHTVYGGCGPWWGPWDPAMAGPPNVGITPPPPAVSPARPLAQIAARPRSSVTTEKSFVAGTLHILRDGKNVGSIYWEPEGEPRISIVFGTLTMTELEAVAYDCRQARGIIEQPAPPATPAQIELHQLDTDRQVFFYEHDFYPLSNFSSFTLQWKGIRFDTSEAAYHWEKFQGLLHGAVIAERIRTAPSAHEAFQIAREHRHLRREDWDEVKVPTMRALFRAKAEQHEYVRRKLLSSGERELVEDSWRDDFWGWGKNRGGQNMSGKLWMEIRAELGSREATAASFVPA